MSDYQNPISSVEEFETNKLSICLFSTQQQLSNLVAQLLSSDRYELNCFNSRSDFIDRLRSDGKQIDCVVAIDDLEARAILKHLWQLEILLPVIILELEQPEKILLEIDNLNDRSVLPTNNIYHRAEIHLYLTQLAEIDSYINIAITKFINLVPSSSCDCIPTHKSQQIRQNLATQQNRLTKKIQQSLGNLKIGDRRNPQTFYKNLSKSKQKKLEQKLVSNYRQILINYFDNNSKIKKSIDEFVGLAFFNNISTSQIIEMHMELIDNFAYQLKIEGRNEDILLDYRLPLIDIMAHLCEMYRCYTSNERVFSELLFAVEQSV